MPPRMDIRADGWTSHSAQQRSEETIAKRARSSMSQELSSRRNTLADLLKELVTDINKALMQNEPAVELATSIRAGLNEMSIATDLQSMHHHSQTVNKDILELQRHSNTGWASKVIDDCSTVFECTDLTNEEILKQKSPNLQSINVSEAVNSYTVKVASQQLNPDDGSGEVGDDEPRRISIEATYST
ncbi:hypothetical protein TREMEDRAFT_59104 [Tremella mesenterica DSM 1558]|uniref:uncharacterized protein n=1 Tax=Tremella mesenterica (strain ATCC 24925 / CBS 8224 / DSM 1558 / NBRC 9311 / NRRL Y-6157 / RJB 2259-6 / UBC 559-6) TaxID=578456 RepID=UPI0003F4A09D|nr:uncharacterized protein TREMEDRAFT_59104 [Tremella mesenterica DSM 1558]EIW72944.1 hypothetical protein TREMEDRAFT_59104 [Tremella mesenterica DSM 1558]